MSKGFRLQGRNVKTPYAQLDLVFISPRGEYCLVEVKSVPSFEYLESRVSESQKQRLRQAHMYWQEKFLKPTRSILAAVNRRNEIAWYPDFLS